jgi:hypothetical protein
MKYSSMMLGDFLQDGSKGFRLGKVAHDKALELHRFGSLRDVLRYKAERSASVAIVKTCKRENMLA